MKYTMETNEHGNTVIRNKDNVIISSKRDDCWTLIHGNKYLGAVHMAGAVGKYHEAAVAGYESTPATWNLNLDDAPRDGTKVDLWVKGRNGGYRAADCAYGKLFDDFAWRTERDMTIDTHNIIAWRPVPDGPQDD